MDPTAQMPAQNRRMILYIGAGILVLILVLVVVFLVQRSRANRLAEEAEQAQIEGLVEMETTECEEVQNAEKCAASVRQNLAEESGNAGYCTGLVDAEYDRCVNLAALAAEEEELCVLIQSEETRSACSLAVLARLPVAERTFAFCEQFDGTQRDDCEFQWILTQAIAGNCEAKQVDATMCAAGAVIAQAQTSRDPDLCVQITDVDLAALCEELVYPGDRDGDSLTEDVEEELGTSDTSIDSDADGLSDADEQQYETDPGDADSDNDGYTDGTEVSSGYNPIGPGPLND